MKIGIVGPIGTESIAGFISDDPKGLPQGYGGGFGGASLLGTLIGELLARGHTVAAFTTSSDLPISPYAEVVAQGNRFRIHYCPVRPHSFRPKFGKLGRAVDAYRIERAALRQAMLAEELDLVHAHWAYEFALAAIASGLPHVITCHDVPRNVLRYMPNPYRLVRYFMARRVMATARTLTVVSPYLRDAIAGSARVPINVIPNPLPPDVMKQRPSQRIVDPRRPRLAMVLNGWGPLKNPQPALIAFSLLRRRLPDAELSLFGYDFEPGAAAQRWADARGIAAGVTFVGSLPNVQLMQALGRADVLVHPSLEETFGMSVAEAMALGVPVIGGSRSGAVPWVIGGGGLLADVTSPQAICHAMLELLLEPAVYARCREAAVERSWGLCSVETVVNQYEQLYRDVVGSDRGLPDLEPAGDVRVAALMTCHNRREHTLACLRALRAAEIAARQTCDVYLLDDGSSDGTAEAVANEFPHVHLLRGDGSLFWNRGMHRVFETALGRGYDFYLGLNDDTLLYADALQRLLACHERITRESGRSGIVAGSTRDATSGELTYGGQVRKKWWKPLTFRVVSPRDCPVECDTVTWNVVLIPDGVARRLGNLEPSFSHAMGDLDYGLRARKAGYSNWVMPGFAGTCSDNPVEGTFLDAGIPFRERLKKMVQPKGLPPQSWLLFCRRHAGPLWMGFWAWPYLRVALESLFGRGGARSRPSDGRK